MSTEPHNPLLDKMDALLKKHRGPGEIKPEVAPEGWLPVLTDVIQLGTPPVAAAAVRSAPPPATPKVDVPPPPPETVTDTLAEQLLSELGPKLSEVMEKQVATELRKSLDETVAMLLSQLDVNMREIVRDAVFEKLKSHKPDA